MLHPGKMLSPTKDKAVTLKPIYQSNSHLMNALCI